MRNAIYADTPPPQAETRAANGGAKPAAGKIGENQCQVHILGAVGQRSGATLTQKKSTASRSAPTTRPSAPTRSEPSFPMLERLELDFAGKTFTADARRLLELNRGHWKVESVHNILDNAFDEDRLRIRTGHGPENTTRRRRFAIGVIRSHTDDCVVAAMRRLNRNPRRVFDYLRMTRNTLRISSTNRRTN